VKILAAAMALALLLTGGSGSCWAQEIGGEKAEAPAATGPDKLLLKDSTVLIGSIVTEGETAVVIRTDSMGELEIPRSEIAEIARSGSPLHRLVDPDANTVMFCPTPATLSKGDTYFRDFELFFLNFGTGITDNFDLSLGTLFPFYSGAFMYSVGGKLRLIDREHHPVGLALTANFTSLENSGFVSFGGVLGAGDAHRSVNLAVSSTQGKNGAQDTLILLGGDVQVRNRVKVFAEYFNTASLLADDFSDLHGFINIGLRLFGTSHSFSFSGFRPLLDDSSGFLAFPMVMYSHHF